MKKIAIIGPTASGKSDLALEMALQHNAYILSIDSLSIYKEIDIASAKPSKEELAMIRHFGVDEIYLNTHFNVAVFIKRYQEVCQKAQEDGKNLIIVGGTSFYLKSMTTGLSDLPQYTHETKQQVAKMLHDLPTAYNYLNTLDPEYMQHIRANDVYRIEKMLLLAIESQLSPTEWFKTHPPKPVIDAIDIFNIDVSRELLRQRIEKRTHKMVEMGLVDEVTMLEHKYGRDHNAMKAIGIIEVLEFLDGFVTKEEMVENIITHTAQLAKRQQTFNRTQFKTAYSASLEYLTKAISQTFH